LPARPSFECYRGIQRWREVRGQTAEAVPHLLRLGAKVCSEPAIDRAFKTIDFLVLFDLFEMDRQMQQMFFGA